MFLFSFLAREYLSWYDATPGTQQETDAARAVNRVLRAAWPEYGRKVDSGWWAGPEHVSPEREPVIVATVSAGNGGEILSTYHRDMHGSVSGCTLPALYQHGPIGMLVIDKRANPGAVFSAPLLSVRSMIGRLRASSFCDDARFNDDPADLAGLSYRQFAARLGELAASPLTETPCELANRLVPDDWTTGEDWRGEPTRERGPRWRDLYRQHADAGAPGGLSHVGIERYAAYWLRHGASVGYREETGAIRYFAGARAGEVERFTPHPPYPDEHQPRAMRGRPTWMPREASP